MSLTLKEMEAEHSEFWTEEEMQSKMNQIHNMDCLEFMKKVPNDYFDLVLTDPPYGINIGRDSIRQKHEKKNWDKEPPSQEFFDEILRVSKNQIIWGGNYFNLPPSKGFLVWDKKQPYNFTLAMAEYAWSSWDYPAKIFSHANRGDEIKVHPTQKPSKLMNFCIDFAQRREDIKNIFDPFMGSGTTAVVSKSMNIDFCGCELDMDYFHVANKRLEQVQGALF